MDVAKPWGPLGALNLLLDFTTPGRVCGHSMVCEVVTGWHYSNHLSPSDSFSYQQQSQKKKKDGNKSLGFFCLFVLMNGGSFPVSLSKINDPFYNNKATSLGRRVSWVMLPG